MAWIRFFEALGPLGRIEDFQDFSGYAVTRAGERSLTVVDADGDGATFRGSDLTYDEAGRVTGGTLNRIEVFSADGATLQTFGRLSQDAAGFYDPSEGLGPLLALVGVQRFGDVVTGSGEQDFLAGLNGDDTIRGGAGDDFIYGGNGDDVLAGGADSDRFGFYRGEGQDRIVDFQDDGSVSDDVIALRQSLYRAMTVTEVRGGVELSFGAQGAVVVEGWDLADVGRSDFSLW